MRFKAIVFILAMVLNFYVFLTEDQGGLTEGVVIAITGIILVIILNAPSSTFERKIEKEEID